MGLANFFPFGSYCLETGTILSAHFIMWMSGPCGLRTRIPGRMSDKQQKPISHSSGAWKSDIRVPAWSGEGPLPGHGLLVPPRGGGGRSSFGLSYKDADPTHELHCHDLTPPKGPTFYYHHTGH